MLNNKEFLKLPVLYCLFEEDEELGEWKTTIVLEKYSGNFYYDIVFDSDGRITQHITNIQAYNYVKPDSSVNTVKKCITYLEDFWGISFDVIN